MEKLELNKLEIKTEIMNKAAEEIDSLPPKRDGA